MARIEEALGKRDAARLFKISPQTIYNWLSRSDLKPRLSATRHRKIDKEALRKHARAYPDMLLRERCVVFDASIQALAYALKTMGIVKKRTKISGSGQYKKGSVFAPILFDGSCEGTTVLWWIKEHLPGTLNKPGVIVMDNAPFHPKAGIRDLL